MPDDYGFFDNVVIRNIHASCALKQGNGHGGMIWFQDNVKHVGTVIIDGFFRSESEDYHNSTHLVEIGSAANIENLIMDHIYQSIPDHKEILTMGDGIHVGHLALNGEDIR